MSMYVVWYKLVPIGVALAGDEFEPVEEYVRTEKPMGMIRVIDVDTFLDEAIEVYYREY